MVLDFIRNIILLGAEYGTISDIELLWCGIAIFGILFSISNVRNATEDLAASRKAHLSPNDPRLHIAVVARRAEVARATIQCIFLLLGILAGTQHDAPSEILTNLQLILRFTFTWGLITASALVSLKSYWAFQIRKDIYAMTDNQKTVNDILDAVEDNSDQLASNSDQMMENSERLSRMEDANGGITPGSTSRKTQTES